MISFAICLPYWISSFLDRRFGRQSWFTFYRHGRINPTRSWEVQLDHFGFSTLLSFELSLALMGQHHAGPTLELNILGFVFRAEAPDNRHWDYEGDCWEEHDDKVEQ